MSSISTFKISIPDAKIQQLKQKLASTSLPEYPNDVRPWSQGPPVSDIRRLIKYWENEFDWRKVEAKLNQFPHFTAKIDVDGFNAHEVHFIHQQSSVKNAIPLLFIHGWPGSFIEVTKILPELVVGGEEFPAFHVVAPSLINFGFSEGSRKKGFGINQHAETCHKLMLALGYEEYVIQAGDVGYLITRHMVLTYGHHHIKAHHLNNTAPSEPTSTSHPSLFAKLQSTPLTGSEEAGLARTAWFNQEGNGYFRKQATKPQTVGYFMEDSPVGLLAWIYECLHDWIDNYPWTDEEILTWISIYYFSRAGPAATNLIYYEIEHSDPPAFAAAQAYSEVPLGISRFPQDLIQLPKLWNHTLGPVVFESEHEKGGHFAAWERPDAIVKDLREMFGRGGGAFGVVKGKNGML